MRHQVSWAGKMKNRYILLIIALVSLLSGRMMGQGGFHCLETWEHKFLLAERIGDSVVTPDGELLSSFFKLGPVLISRQRLNRRICCRGQGPDELENLYAYCLHPEGLAFVELPHRIKIFRRENTGYGWKRTIGLEKSRFLSFISSAVYSDHKWFLAGYFLENFPMKPLYKEVFLKIYDDRGKFIKGLIRNTSRKVHQHTLMDYYVVDGNKNILFLTENRLHVTVISKGTLEIQARLNLETPSCYRPMPEDFYSAKQYRNLYVEMERDMDRWKTAYSRIIFAAYDHDRLVLQIRVFPPAKKKFMALLFNGYTFRPEGRILTNDRLMGVRGGKYYFYANGDPYYEEEADRCRIRICRLEK